jgi:hypothetical protein
VSDIRNLSRDEFHSAFGGALASQSKAYQELDAARVALREAKVAFQEAKSRHARASLEDQSAVELLRAETARADLRKAKVVLEEAKSRVARAELTTIEAETLSSKMNAEFMRRRKGG